MMSKCTRSIFRFLLGLLVPIALKCRTFKPEPKPQLEGGTIRLECNASYWRYPIHAGVEYLKITASNSKSLKETWSLEFYPWEDRRVTPKTNRKWSYRFFNPGGQNKSNRNKVSLVLLMVDVRCKDMEYLYTCSANLVSEDPRKNDALVTTNTEIIILEKPKKVQIWTHPEGQGQYFENAAQTSLQIMCSFLSSSYLTPVWRKYVPGFNDSRVAATEKASVIAYSPVKGPQSCRSTNRNVSSTLPLTLVRDLHYQAFTCSANFRDQVVAESNPIVIFVLPQTLKLRGRTAPLGPSIVYEGHKATIKCTGLLAGARDSQVASLHLMYSDESRPTFPDYAIAAYEPFADGFNKRYLTLDLLQHPHSSVKVSGGKTAEKENRESIEINWSIRRAQCSGRGIYICSAWSFDARRRLMKIATVRQAIDFLCNIKFGRIKAFTDSGVEVPATDARPGQSLTGACHFLGPKSAQWKITYAGTSLLNVTTTDIKQPAWVAPSGISSRDVRCICFRYEARFRFKMLANADRNSRKSPTCKLSVKKVSETLSYGIEAHQDLSQKNTRYVVIASMWAIFAVMVLLASIQWFSDSDSELSSVDTSRTNSTSDTSTHNGSSTFTTSSSKTSS